MREASSALPKKPARAVRKIKKGKIAKRMRKAMLPASGIASSAKSRRMASRRSLGMEGRGSVMRKAYQRWGFDARSPDESPHLPDAGSRRPHGLAPVR